MAALRRRYTKEFKLELVNRSLGDERVIDLAEEFKINPVTISRWRREYLRSEEKVFPGEGNEKLTPAEKRVRELEKELREAKLESEILKKAIRIFSKSDGKSTTL